MKIIRINDIRIIYKDLNTYTIKTPIGVFKEVDDAIQVYPYLKDHKNIKQCNYCGRYFIKVGKRNNARRYCSNECSEAYKKLNKKENDRMWRRDKYLRDKNSTILSDKEHRWDNPEYHQNDTFWGVGASNLSSKPMEDEQHEHNAIRFELRRLGLEV